MRELRISYPPTGQWTESIPHVGESKESGCETLLFLGSDGSLMSVKWHNIKISLRYSESIEKPIVAPPKWTTGGCSNLSCPTLDSAMKSAAQYPNVKPGEEFTGYKKLVAKSA